MIEDTSVEDVLDDAELVDLVALLIERLHGHFLTDPLRLRRALSVLGRRFDALAAAPPFASLVAARRLSDIASASALRSVRFITCILLYSTLRLLYIEL